MNRRVATLLALGAFVLLGAAALAAPAHLAEPEPSRSFMGPGGVWPFGADRGGRPLLEYAQQGARVVLGPAMVAGGVVALSSIVGGLLRCVGDPRVDAAVQGVGEVLGALPRMVVILVTALLIPSTSRGLLPLAVAWAVLASPGAMDEAAAVAERLGGARFVEALRAHGFSWPRIFLFHVVALNLRPVVVRQAAEVVTQVTFLELGLSYLAVQDAQASFTHPDSLKSWADLLYMGYPSIVLDDVPTGHALWTGLAMVALVTGIAKFATTAARAR